MHNIMNSPIQLTSVHLRNYRCHRDLQVDFDAQFSVIVGVNGSGKTALLRGVCDALVGLTHMRVTSPWQGLIDQPDTAFEAVQSAGTRLRFEPIYPVSVHAQGVADGAVRHWCVIKQDEINPAKIDHANYDEFSPSRIDNGKAQALTLPLMLFYRANRNWPPHPVDPMQAATQKLSRADAYANWTDASSTNAALQTWVLGKSLERVQLSSERGVGLHEIDDDELAQVNAALTLALPECRGLRFDLLRKSVLVDWLTDDRIETVPFENLSDGQRTIVGLVADIARRMCILNPQLGTEVTARTPGVILIDELDVHLHPKWQRLIAGGLQRAFPLAQFITASHSPQILGELKPEQIILLRPGRTAHPDVSYGLDAGQVLSEVMDAEPRAIEVSVLLADLFKSLERGELASARRQIDQLRHTAPGIPELTGAEALLLRKEVLGR